MDKPTPRINSALRENYVEQTVRIVGKIQSFNGETAVIVASDQGHCMVKVNGENSWSGSYVEVIGRINKDYSITEFKSTSLGDDFDLELANKVVEYGQKYKEIFE
ncbi:replication factor A protein 3 [Phascolomyces articulosus]|uniref:Replication factor A protein 3 n=1 Tax=Phascolomyces articulosus TaxID=60185 RepID=A0AAD5K284_9FUNG|nr:replication factor A protein 3 [Phascolomyces articulosus]